MGMEGEEEEEEEEARGLKTGRLRHGEGTG